MILVLDLDGVVMTGHPEGGRWDKNLERDLGLRADLLQQRFFAPHFKPIVLGQADLYDMLRRVWPELKCESGVEAFVDYWFSSDSVIDKDVLLAVQEWRRSGRKSYLATNQEHHRARYVWSTLGLSTHFDGMVYSAELGAQKPDGAFFARVLEKLGVSDPAEILFLDDAVPNIEAANTAGWKGSHYRGIQDLRSALADFATGHSGL
jgi:putative hydrolase of the HAD superfamily